MIYTKSEKKYIITYKGGKIKHFIFPASQFHEFFARDNGFNYFSQVIESGLLIEGRAFILTCKNKGHAARREYRQSLPAASIKAREVQSLYAYKIERNGD
jgi:hypothetical protein